LKALHQSSKGKVITSGISQTMWKRLGWRSFQADIVNKGKNVRGGAKSKHDRTNEWFNLNLSVDREGFVRMSRSPFPASGQPPTTRSESENVIVPIRPSLSN
jgi:hypothetical protein